MVTHQDCTYETVATLTVDTLHILHASKLVGYDVYALFCHWLETTITPNSLGTDAD